MNFHGVVCESMAAGRPISFWMRHEFIEQISAAAEKHDMTRSEYVLTAIRRSLAEDSKKGVSPGQKPKIMS